MILKTKILHEFGILLPESVELSDIEQDDRTPPEIPENFSDYRTTSLITTPLRQLTISDYLSVIKLHLPELLVPQKKFDRINSMAQDLPGALSHSFVWECKFGQENIRQVDFSLKVDRDQAKVLAGHFSDIRIPSNYLNEPVWENFCDFSLLWIEPNSIFSHAISVIWLEFDMDGLIPLIPIPCIFFGPKRLGKVSPQEIYRVKWIDLALESIIGGKISGSAENNLHICLQNLPQSARVFSIGVMLARKHHVIRVCIKDIHPKEIIPYLSGLGDSDDMTEIQYYLHHLTNLVDRINLNIDLSDEFGKTVGLECYFGNQSFSNRQSRFQAFLNFLFDNQLCPETIRDALIEFPGFDDIRTNPDLWPEQIILASTLIGEKYNCILRKDISHIKIVFRPHKKLEAKIYLDTDISWLSKKDTAMLKLAFPKI